MKKITEKSTQISSQKKVLQINILYIIAFQLLGITSVLFMEYQPLHSSSAETSIAYENTQTEYQDMASIEVCSPTGCQRIGP
ncbi:MAG: putative negative regulator of RcsB-dependent stress response [Ulvibacter sp.]|jgi:predicted negative regulator of RcsB-dependent stress response